MSEEATTTEIEVARGVPVTIGGSERRLILDFNALASMEEATGENMLFFDKWSKPTAKILRAGIWAALLHDDPDVSIEQVGAWITEVGPQALIGPFIKARAAALPKAKDDGEKRGSRKNPPSSES